MNQGNEPVRQVTTRFGTVVIKGIVGERSPRPVVAFVRGVFAKPLPLQQMKQPLRFLADVVEVALPGVDGPALADNTVAGIAVAIDEALEVTFPYRPIVLCGVSIGAVVALASRARNVARIVALEPTLRPAGIWPADAAMSALDPKTADEKILRFLREQFGEPGEPGDRPDHSWVLRRLHSIADVLISNDPLLPPRPVTRWPSLVDDATRSELAAHRLIRLRTTSAAGHNLFSGAQREVVELLQEACRRAAAVRPFDVADVDEALLEATPLTARRVGYLGENGSAFAAALLARAPLVEVVQTDLSSADATEGLDALVVADADLHTLADSSQRLAPGGWLIARWSQDASELDRALEALAAGGLQRVADRHPADRGVLRFEKRASPAETSNRLGIDFVTCADILMEIRTRLPTQALRSEPTLDIQYLQGSSRLGEKERKAANITIVQRPKLSAEECANLMAQAIHDDRLIILEFDDHPQAIADFFGRPLDPDAWDMFRAVHAVQTTTPPLVRAFLEHNPEVSGFENAVFELMPAAGAKNLARVFYGGVKRGRYAVEVAASLVQAVKAAPDLEFVVIGDKDIFDALPTRRKQLFDYMPYEAYLGVLSTCGISLSPIEGRRYQDTKSDAKYLDAARAGVLTIASPTIYDRTIQHGVNGLLAHTVSDWDRLLTQALTQRTWARGMAENAWRDVRETRMFANQVEPRRAWYFDLWGRRHAINEAVVARAPLIRERLARLRTETAADCG